MPRILIHAIKNEDKVSEKGKNYTSCSIKTIDNNGQEVWISGFGNSVTKSWRKGQTVDLDIYKQEYKGKEYLKFKDVPERSIWEEIDKINAKLDQLLGNKPLKELVSPVYMPAEPIGEDPRQEEPTAEELDKMFG